MKKINPLKIFFEQISPDWTLFLDRDGVINVRLLDDYVKTTEEFVLMPQIKPALLKLSAIFGKIVVVTNQQGIGKGLMSEQDLELIHQKMLVELHTEKKIIDKIYFCAALKNQNSPRRKPQIGMALDAKKDFPDICFQKSLMIGDTPSDMEFGKNAGMKTIFFGENPSPLADFCVRSWAEILECIAHK